MPRETLGQLRSTIDSTLMRSWCVRLADAQVKAAMLLDSKFRPGIQIKLEGRCAGQIITTHSSTSKGKAEGPWPGMMLKGCMTQPPDSSIMRMSMRPLLGLDWAPLGMEGVGVDAPWDVVIRMRYPRCSATHFTPT